MAKSKMCNERLDVDKEMQKLFKYISLLSDSDEESGDSRRELLEILSRGLESLSTQDDEMDDNFEDCQEEDNQPSKIFPLESFSVNINEAKKFHDMIISCVGDSEKWQVPSIFIIKGKEGSGKSSLLASLFDKDDITAAFLSDLPIQKPGRKIKSDIDLVIVEHPNGFKYCDAEFFSTLEGKVIIVEIDDDEMPESEDGIIMSLPVDELSAEVVNGEVNNILNSHGVPNIKLEESDLAGEKKRLLTVPMTKDILAHNLMVQKEFSSISSAPFEDKLIDAEKFHNRYPNPSPNDEIMENPLLQAEYTKFFQIFQRLNKPARHLTVDRKMLTKLGHLLDTHPNLQDRGLLESILKMTIILSKDNEIHLPPILLVGPPGCGKTLLCHQLRELFGQDNDVFIPIGTGRGADYLMGATQGYRDATHGAVLASAWNALDGMCCHNPLIVLDEVEKGSFSKRANDVNQDILPPLLQLLGDINMENFRDAFFDVPLEKFRPNFIATANSLDPIPEPLLNRFVGILNFRDYTKKEFLDLIIPMQYEKFREERNKKMLPKMLDAYDIEIIYELSQGKTRHVQTAIIRYFAECFDMHGRRHTLNESQVEKLINDVKNCSVKPQIGFCK